MITDNYLCFFFFFQAEDGIRDKLVTGVQTCALPIYAGDGGRLLVLSGVVVSRRPAVRREAARPEGPLGGGIPGLSRLVDRSEERRVGEEGRSRWSPYH